MFAFTSRSHDRSDLIAEVREPLFYTYSHHTAGFFLDIPLLAHPRVVRVLGTTGVILTFTGQVQLFVRFRRFQLPHVFISQQLDAFLPIHKNRTYASLHCASTSGRGAFAFASGCHRAFTSTTHGTGTTRERPLFLYLFFTDFVHGHGHGLGHAHGHGLGVVGVDPTFGWRCGAPRVDLPLRRPW